MFLDPCVPGKFNCKIVAKVKLHNVIFTVQKTKKEDDFNKWISNI